MASIATGSPHPLATVPRYCLAIVEKMTRVSLDESFYSPKFLSLVGEFIVSRRRFKALNVSRQFCERWPKASTRALISFDREDSSSYVMS